MSWVFRLFGYEVASLEHVEFEQPTEISGGSSHNFERDTEPADPDDRYRWDEEFGFR